MRPGPFPPGLVAARVTALVASRVAGISMSGALAGQRVSSSAVPSAGWPASATYAEPANRYDHNIMGRIRGWGRLEVDLSPCSTCSANGVGIDHAQSRVFEDFAPRLWDITGDGLPEIVTFESDLSKGAWLPVWEVKEGRLRRLATTAYLGTRHLWLAPIGAADFDRDGAIEIAYVEKPHLARVLRLVRLEGDQLIKVASLAGVTNHAIGQEQVESRVRRCRGVPEIVALSADGQHVLAITWDNEGLKAREIGRATSRQLPAGLKPC